MSWDFGNNDVQIISYDEEGRMQPGFEKSHKYVVVVSPNGVQIRQYEQLEMGHSKYAIHTENVPAHSRGVVDFDRFIEIFKRQYCIDSFDVRKAVKMAVKVAYLQ